MRLGWSTCNGKKKSLLATFSVSVLTMMATFVFACLAPTDMLPSFQAFLGNFLMHMGDFLDKIWNPPPSRILWRHPKDPIPSWGTPDLPTYTCESLVKDLTLEVVLCTRPSPLLSRVVRWQPCVEGVTLLELFGSTSIGLAVVLEAILHVTCYIYIDPNIVTRNAT